MIRRTMHYTVRTIWAVMDSDIDNPSRLLTVRRVRDLALKIGRTMEPSPDLLVIEVAALMHDMADKKYVRIPEGMSLATYFTPVFEGLDLPEGSKAIDILGQERIELIGRVVENVSWTTEKRLRKEGLWGKWHSECEELHCVQDADRLDAIGAIGSSGFSSCVMTGS